MLIEILESPVLINKKEVLKNIRLNIAENHKFRLKMNYVNKNEDVPIDIVCFNWNISKLEKMKLSLGIDINGKEMIRSLAFNLKLSFDIIKRRWFLNGTIGNNVVSIKTENQIELLLELCKLIKTVK